MTPIILIFIGFIVGSIGTLIGAGGGFLLVPFLLFMYPEESPNVVTSISLAIVFLNSASGTLAYAKNRRVDYRAGVTFAIASVPGALAGALAVAYVSRGTFEPVFGLLMLIGGLYIYLRPLRRNHQANGGDAMAPQRQYSLKIGVVISLVVGFISSFLGIGGGIVHVPTLIHLLEFPVHIATATSHFVLTIMSFVATCVHAYEGTLFPYLDRILMLGIPAVVGAQVGAALSKKVHEKWIVRGLAVVLMLVGIRLILN